MSYDFEPLIRGCETLGLSLSERQLWQFQTYYEFLVEKNQVMNLTAITEFREVLVKHFLDSLMAVSVVDFSKIHSMIDVGTGAGFPGIPLKIVFPQLELCLLDSLNKRINFLREVVSVLSLESVDTVHGRAEDIARRKEYRERFDLCVSRAVSNLSTLSEYTLPFIHIGGSFVAYKSNSSDEEIDTARRGIKILGGRIVSKGYVTIPETEIERTLVLIEKEKGTSAKYPRRAGTPLREPL